MGRDGFDMKFVDPPHTKAVYGKWSYDWTAVATQLRKNPGEWAILDEEGKISVANAIRQGSIKDLHPSDGFEITVTNTNRKVKPPTCTIHVRYVKPETKKGRK